VTALPGFAPNRWFRAAATSLQKARASIVLTAASFLGYRKLLIANKTDTTLSGRYSFAQRGSEQRIA
jgi:hypothetical protein